MKKSGNLNGNFEYELLDENQQDYDLREKLVALYSSPFSDILWWKLHDTSLVRYGYYKLFYYEQSVLQHIILFKYSTQKPKTIFVLNQRFKISLQHIENICNSLFCEFKKTQEIIFEKVLDANPEQSPKMIFEKTDNVVAISLPESMESYMKSTIGRKTRKHIKLAMDNFTSDFPDYKILYFEKGDILFEHISKIVLLNKDRMKSKGIIHKLNDIECKILHQYVSESGFGLVCLCTIDDKIIGGTISSIIGEHAYTKVIAHDNLYNKYFVGQITLVYTIKYLIEEKNIKDHHLGLGNQDYKFRHGGINHDLYTVLVFRNHGLYYFREKLINVFIENYRKFRHRLKEDKTLFRFYVKLNVIIFKIDRIMKSLKIKSYFCL